MLLAILQTARENFAKFISSVHYGTCRDKLIRFWDQKDKGQGHSEILRWIHIDWRFAVEDHLDNFSFCPFSFLFYTKLVSASFRTNVMSYHVIIYTLCLKKVHLFHFCDYSVKCWSILIIFGNIAAKEICKQITY